MFNALKAYSTVLATLTAPRKDEKGQGTLEYLGIAIVAVILVGAVVAALGEGTAIQDAISAQIDKVIAFGG